jgi:hypothetical protein
VQRRNAHASRAAALARIELVATASYNPAHGQDLGQFSANSWSAGHGAPARRFPRWSAIAPWEYRKGERICHVPGSDSYGWTGISTSRGERWFFTEEEARKAG